MNQNQNKNSMITLTNKTKNNHLLVIVTSSRPPSSVPNSSNKSVKASLNSIIPCAGIAICERGPPRDIVWET